MVPDFKFGLIFWPKIDLWALNFIIFFIDSEIFDNDLGLKKNFGDSNNSLLYFIL